MLQTMQLQDDALHHSVTELLLHHTFNVCALINASYS